LTAVTDRRYSSGMIIRARTVVTMDGPPIDNGAIAVCGNQIVDAGNFNEIKACHAGEVIDLGEQALLPGLINAHCHLDYTCLRGKIPPQKSFSDWIRAINTEKAQLSPHDYVASINEGFAEAKRFGTTTIANLTAFPKLVGQIHAPIRTWWFAELIDVRAPEAANELVDSAMEALDQTENRGLAPHALFTASENIYCRCNQIAQRENILLTTHLAESREEMRMFRDAAGPLYEFLRHIGRPMDDCGNKTPLTVFMGAFRHACSATALQAGGRALPNWIVAHLNELSESDFKLLERSAFKFHIVHCPCSRDYFCHSQFPLERLRALGFNICLGTDSLASNDSLSLFDEMRAFQKRFPSIPPEETLRMVTVNPALALRQENELGRIRPGFKADLIAVPCSGSADVFEQINAFDGPVSWAMVNGECE
jgi:cytosine/adenosine deaminase-related metal-dependent hydrolase